MKTPVHEGARPRAGRPRDPTLESRVLMAALQVYAEAGWHGFSFEAVGRRASVGKAPLYLRWASKEDLLEAAFNAHTEMDPIQDTGNVRDDLVEYAGRLLQVKSTPEFWAFLRIHLEASINPELHSRHYSQVLRPIRDEATKLLKRAVERGDLPADTPISLLLDSLYGAILVRTMILSRPDQRAQLAANRDSYAIPIVDFVLERFLNH